MSDRIERLRLTPKERETAYTGDLAIFFAPHGLEQVANAQLERVLSAEVGCRCLTTYRVSDGQLEVTAYDRSHAIQGCNLCAGTGKVTVRQILERDGGEK